MDWNEKSRPWINAEAEIEAVHSPVAKQLLKRAALRRGHKVLDIGCGSGGTVLSIADLVGPDGGVTGIDIAPPMIARASERTATITQVTLVAENAQSFAFAPATFDMAISMFGMMFYTDPGAAFSNILQAIRPSGRLLFASWAGGKDNPWFAYPRMAAELHIGDLPPPVAHAPGPLAFADGNRVLKLMSDAGWEDTAVDPVDLHLTPSGPPDAIAAMLFQLGPTSDMINATAADDHKRNSMTAAVQAEIAASLAAHDGPSGVRVPAKVNFFSARRPG